MEDTLDCNAVTKDDCCSMETMDSSRPEYANRRGWSAETVHLLLAHRLPAALLLGAAAAIMLTGRLLTNPLYRCPFRSLTDLPCPGCGLSRAGWLMLDGRFDIMWRVHPFTPYFAIWGIMLLGAAILPGQWHARWAAAWAKLESYTKMHAIILIGFVLFGVARLLGRITQPL